MLPKGSVAVKVKIRESEITITDEVKVVSLDKTNAVELLIEFEANKVAKATLEAEYEVLKENIYTLLGYKKYADKWIGTAEEGTIGGVAVVKVATQTRTNFDTKAFVVANPELLEKVVEFTTSNIITMLKTVR